MDLYYYEYVYYDWNLLAIRADVYENYDNKAYIYSILERLDLGRIYEINTDGTCYYEETNTLTQACIPDGGNRFTATIGGSLTTDIFTFLAPSGKNISEFGVTESACYPIFGIFFERQGQLFIGDFDVTYFNLQPQINDPFIFNPPFGCTLVNPGTIIARERRRLDERAHQNKLGRDNIAAATIRNAMKLN